MPDTLTSIVTRQKYTNLCIGFMDNLIAQHLRDLYGLTPDSPHPALLLPRLPPVARRMLGAPKALAFARLGDPGAMARADFDMSQSAFRERAATLVEDGNPMPSGHPLNHKKSETAMLKTEIERLRKENDLLTQRLKESAPDRLGIQTAKQS